jgi:hypothetical protein
MVSAGREQNQPADNLPLENETVTVKLRFADIERKNYIALHMQRKSKCKKN